MSELNLSSCPICHARDTLSRESIERAGQSFVWYECRECGSVLLWMGDDQWAYQKVGREDKAYLLKQPMTASALQALLAEVEQAKPGTLINWDVTARTHVQGDEIEGRHEAGRVKTANKKGQQQIQAVCPECNTPNPVTANFCGSCGASLESAKVVQEVQTVKPATRPKRSRRMLWLILVIIVACVVLWLAMRGGGPAPASPPARDAPATFVTLDGYDKDAGIIAVQAINVWKDYNDRGAGIVGTGQHGEKVKLVQRSGDAVQIELRNGERGWVTYYFIREYK